MIPWPVLSLGEIKVDTTTSCGVTQMEHDKTQWGGEFSTVGSVRPHVPVWFNLIHLISKSITGTAIASIPCNGDIRSTMFEIDNQRIADPNLIEEVAQFTNECYAPSPCQTIPRQECDRKLDRRKRTDYEVGGRLDWFQSVYGHRWPR